MRRETDDRKAAPLRAPVLTGYVVGGAAALLAAAFCLAWSAWEAPAPDPLQLRIFLLAWLLSALVAVFAVATTALPERSVELPRWTLVFGLGALAGVAAATTPWRDLGEVFWYQLWWSAPVAAGLLVALRPGDRPRQA